jgi:hypothetical protein
MIRRISIPYYLKFIIFYMVFNGCFIGMLFAFDKPESEAVPFVLFRFFALFMFVFGFYIVSFVHGLYFQTRNGLTLVKTGLFAGLLFLIQLISFFPVWQPHPFQFSVKTHYLLMQCGFQALSFLAASFLIKLISYFKQSKK